MIFKHDGKVIPLAPNKDPNSIIDYGCDWTDWLAQGEVISTSTWTVPTGLTSVSTVKENFVTSIFLSGGTVGTTYTLTNRITTNQSRTEDASMYIRCQQK